MISQFLIQLPLCLVPLLLFALNVEAADQENGNIARRGCKDTCGDVRIPFPFGIGANCFLDHWFEIECNASPNSKGFTKPFLSKFNIELKEVTKDMKGIQRVIVGIPPMKACTADTQPQQAIDLRGSPYNFSSAENVFLVDGCSGGALLLDQNKTLMAGCGTVCNKPSTQVAISSCSGVECCQTSLYSAGDFPFYQVEFNNHSSSEHQNCLVAALIYDPSAYQYSRKLSAQDASSAVPVVLYWSWISNLPSNSAGQNITCIRHDNNTLVCNCIDSTFGNPYVYGGCIIPDECEDCLGSCYPSRNSYYCTEKASRFPALATIEEFAGLNLLFGVLFMVISGYLWIYRIVTRASEMNRRASFFKRNGGLLLQQHLSSKGGFIERVKIFTTDELDKASDNFNENRILGQGGQGTVYKGILTDGTVVAIKKTRVLDGNQLEQFINEVVILSQINHRNVVKILGCCLETEVPLLVYEFISNGTLYQNIHGPDEDFFISWEMRLKIAADSAGAIAYLHSSSSFPIYHRDIKSSNILLDGKHRAKVSDFGCSKTIAIDQTHLTTNVKGTWGYFDPEYFQTHQFTDKSDVYSFGVLLVELLTSKKPIYMDGSTMEPKNLAMQFLILMEKSGLSRILDPKIVNDAKEEELMAVVELARCCLSGKGRLRPTMKEVAITLEMIIKSPAEVPTLDEQAFPYEEFGESVMAETEISDAEFMSTSLPAGVQSPLYIDVQPNTI